MNNEQAKISNERFAVILENLGTQLVQIMENNNNLLVENLRLWKENSELRKEVKHG
jgi:hypothetical protein